MLENGVYVCDKCLERDDQSEKMCYILMEANNGGNIHLEFNVSEIQSADESRILLYEGANGRNVLKNAISSIDVHTFDLPGASALVMMSVPKARNSQLSFTMKFSTDVINGTEPIACCILANRPNMRKVDRIDYIHAHVLVFIFVPEL
ncbi:hypothetical protein FBUS_06269 [Fasciolopsis buskii]|uniref:Uncharacterized protein n=1 Tax=Fasciolopsis buskii TaxID=27845 RepID=A0A8E0S455_9TREM|nr:hypothetical protein FBUS_06269 [Fasciolopsis buski]